MGLHRRDTLNGTLCYHISGLTNEKQCFGGDNSSLFLDTAASQGVLTSLDQMVETGGHFIIKFHHSFMLFPSHTGWRRSLSYPQQDADSTGHAHLAHPDHRHLVPGRLSSAAGLRADKLLEHWGHDCTCRETERNRKFSQLVKWQNKTKGKKNLNRLCWLLLLKMGQHGGRVEGTEGSWLKPHELWVKCSL